MNKFREHKVFDNPESLAEYAGKIWKILQLRYTEDGLFYLSSPLSSTPLPLYHWIIKNAASIKNWHRFRLVLMDEQVESNKNFEYVDANDLASYENFALNNLLNPLQEKTNAPLKKSILKPNLNKLDLFDKEIGVHNGIDLLILAIGVRGHFAHVMPGTKFETGFHVTKLIPELVQFHTKGNSKSYAGAKFREFGMSLGYKQVLSAKNIIVIIMGENKKELAKQLFSYEKFNEDFPMSIIHHPEVFPKTHVLLTKNVVD
jgi:glucosamine-6-phosphate deaminase